MFDTVVLLPRRECPACGTAASGKRGENGERDFLPALLQNHRDKIMRVAGVESTVIVGWKADVKWVGGIQCCGRSAGGNDRVAESAHAPP